MLKLIAILLSLLSLTLTETQVRRRQTEGLPASLKPHFVTLEAVSLPQENLPMVWLETFEPTEGVWESNDLPQPALEPLE